MVQQQGPARVGDVVLQEGGPHGHAHLVPAVAFVVDGLDRAGRPAGQVPVESGFALWNKSFRKLRPVIWEQTCPVGHLHTLLNFEVLLLAQACDSSGQHAPVWPDELAEQQNILVVILVLQVPAADGALTSGVGGVWTFLGSLCDSAFDQQTSQGASYELRAQRMSPSNDITEGGASSS